MKTLYHRLVAIASAVADARMMPHGYFKLLKILPIQTTNNTYKLVNMWHHYLWVFFAICVKMNT